MAFGEGGGHCGLGTSQVRARPVRATGPRRGSPTPRKAAARAEGQCPLPGLTLFLTPAPSPDPLPTTSLSHRGRICCRSAMPWSQFLRMAPIHSIYDALPVYQALF